MEKEIKIKISDKLSIYGMLNGSPNKPLFIIIHGLLGNMDEEFYVSATNWFGKNGFSTFRLNLFGYQKDARQLMDCSISTHGSDLDLVIRHFRKLGFKKIFVAGHSFGGLVIIKSIEQDFDGAILWDPSYKISFKKGSDDFPSGKYLKNIEGYLMRWGINVVIGKKMVEETETLPWDSITENFRKPLKIIVAGKGELGEAKKYLNKLKSKKELKVVSGATHYFNDKKGMQEQVFEISEKWFKSFYK